MRFTIERANTWEDINGAATIDGRCIGFGKGNHDKAKLTWELYNEFNDCIYFLIKSKEYPVKVIGYVRLLCVGITPIKTWIADFVSPSKYEPVYLVAQHIKEYYKGCVLVKDFVSDDDILKNYWNKFSTTFMKLEKYPYHQTPISESGWFIVPV